MRGLASAWRPSRRLVAGLLLGAAGLAFVWLAVPYAYMPLGGEQGVFSYAAWRLSEGEVIYRDFTCHDAAGIYLVHYAAHGLFGWEMPALRRFDLLWETASFAAAGLALSRLAGGVAASLGLLFVVLSYFSLGYQAMAQRDGFTLLPFLLALLLTLQPVREGKARDAARWVVVGCLVACMFWIKPPMAALGAACLLTPSTPSTARGQGGQDAPAGPLRAHGRRLACLALGFALPTLGWLAYFAAHGALGSLAECLVLYNLQYTGVRFGLGEQAVQLLLQSLRFPVYLVGLLALGAGSLRRPFQVLAAGTWIAALVVVVQGKLLPYHLVPLHLLLSLWCGVGVVWLWNGAGTAWRGARRAAAVLVAGGLAASAVPHLARVGHSDLWRFLFEEGGVRTIREEAHVAVLVRDNSEPSDPILVWGTEQSGLIPFMSRRRVPVRWVMNYPFSAFDPDTPLMRRWRREYMEQLAAAPPRLIVVVGGDAYPGIGNLDSRDALARFGELQQFVDAHYTPIAHLEGSVSYDVYRRREPTGVEKPPRVRRRPAAGASR